MDQVEGGSRQSVALPSINHLDLEKHQREEDYQRKHSAPAMVSPSSHYSIPPPPYGQAQTTVKTNPIPSALSGLISPPESRRTSGDEKEQRQPQRQSLPSIHEALGADQPISYPPVSAATTSIPQPYHPHQSSSPLDHRKSFPADSQNQPTPNSYAPTASRSPFMNQAPALTAPYSHNPPDPNLGPPMASSQTSKLPTLHPIRTNHSPITAARQSLPYSYQQPPQQQTSPAYEQSAPPSGSMNGPYAYQPYPPSQYPYSAPPPSASGSMFPPSASATYSAPPRYPPTWRSDGTEINRAEENKRAGRVGGFAYGESVKRHLENFDIEASLNEIADSSGRMLDFSKHYGQRAHQTQRSGPVVGSLPSLQEVDDLMKQSHRLQEAMQRIREVVVTQQVAMEQAQDNRYKAGNGYDPEDSAPYQDDSKGGGFAGADPKKRRGGRAAPPGRCHSCNRAETPEWRRGPDGARTLCNACGLHYAKLTRKMGTNKAAIGSSNLRPRSMGPGSPNA